MKDHMFYEHLPTSHFFQKYCPDLMYIFFYKQSKIQTTAPKISNLLNNF